MSEELKPCPFCGGEVEFRESHVTGEGGYVAHVEPNPCYFLTFGALSGESNADCIAAWNTRAA